MSAQAFALTITQLYLLSAEFDFLQFYYTDVLFVFCACSDYFKTPKKWRIHSSEYNV